MDKNKIIQGLKSYDKVHVELFAEYCYQLEVERKRDGSLKNPWMKYKNEAYLIDCFKKVDDDGLVFDGKNVTLLSTGTSYNYQAYKNKMLLAYPETIIDDDLVYTGDVFSFKKESGKVIYSHDMVDPFLRTDDQIMGGYCVIKNRRGEFITILNKDDIDKHRKVAKTDYIWEAWFVEMARKTVVKKACKKHFNDIFQNIIDSDNENMDITNPLDIEIDIKSKIEAFTDVKKLGEYYLSIKDNYVGESKKGLNKLIAKKKAELEDAS